MLTLVPDTDSEIVRAAAVRAGSHSLVFGTSELLAEIEVLGGLKAGSQASRTRFLRALQSGDTPVVLRVPSRVSLICHPLPRVPAVPAVRGAFVLVERLPDLRAADLSVLDDPARVLLALKLAELLSGGQPVGTAIVTRVMHAVPALRVRSTQDTNVLLHRLAAGPKGTVTRIAGRRASVAWQVSAELLACWTHWICDTATAYRDALSAPAAVAKGGGASLVDLAARVVAATSAAKKSAMWPQGRPVTVREIKDTLGSALTGKDAHDPLYAMALPLEQSSRGLDDILRDAERPTFGSSGPRRKPLLRAVRASATAQVAYAPLSLPAQHATDWASWEALRNRGATRRMNDLVDEWDGAIAAAASRCPVVKAITSVRQWIVASETDALLEETRGLLDRAGHISAAFRSEVEQRHLLVLAGRKLWPATSALRRAAVRRVRDLSFELDEVIAAKRPTMSAPEYAALLPATISGGLSPAALAGNSTRVRRVPIGARGTKTRVGAGRGATLLLDRADAVLDAAQQASLPALPALLGAAAVVGRRVAHVGLVRQLVASDDARAREAGLAALVLIDDVRFLAKTLRRRVAEPDGLADPRVAVTVVELSYWADAETRALVLAAAGRETTQAVLGAARRVRLAGR